MKFTIKIALFVSLFCTTAVIGLADDGEMGTGNRNCEQNCLVAQQQPTVEDKDTTDIFIFVRNFLNNFLS